MSEGMVKDEDLILNGLSPEMKERMLHHLDKINKIFPIDGGPLSDLISSYKKSMETINRIPSLLTDKLTDHFRINRDVYAQQFKQDVNLLIKAGDLRELDDHEISMLTQAAKDSMEAMFSSLLDAMSKVLGNYLRWSPSSLDSSSVDGAGRKTVELFKNLKLQLALAKAEADKCHEEIESLRESMMPKVGGRYRVLEVLEKSNEPMRITEIAVGLNLAEVTVRRYIKALEREGLVERVSDGKPYRYVLRDKDWRRKLVAESWKKRARK